MWQVTFLSHHINLQQKAAGYSRGRRLCRAVTWDLCTWCVRRHILREGQCVFPLPQLHNPCMRHLVTGRERWDGKNTKGGTGAVIKGLGNVILLCGMSKACSEFLPAGGGGTSLSRPQAGSWPVKMTGMSQSFLWGCTPGHTRGFGGHGDEFQLCQWQVAPHLNPSVWLPSGGGVGWAFPES